MIPDGNWTEITNMTSRIHFRAGQKCDVVDMLPHNKNETWYLTGSVTNAEPKLSMPVYQRHYLQEFVPSNGSSAMDIPLPNVKTGEMERRTTVILKWRLKGLSFEKDKFDDPQRALFQTYQNNL